MDSGKKGFVGMPSSASALMIISIPFLGNQWSDVVPEIGNYIVPILFSLLMVSNVPMFNLKGLNLGLKANIYPIIYAVTMLPAIYFSGMASDAVFPFCGTWHFPFLMPS